MTGYVYFIQAHDSGHIKIGRSRDPIARLAALQTSSPEQLDLLGFIPGTQHTERALHLKHEQYHLRGEWFRPGIGLMADIAHLLRVDRPTAEQVTSATAATKAMTKTSAGARLSASAAAHLSWANTRDRSARTAPARAALEQRFLDQADGDPARAAHLRKAYFQRLAIKSAAARRAKKG